MKAILEAKKKELLVRMEQGHLNLNQLHKNIIQTEDNIHSLEGALQVVEELSREVELNIPSETINQKPSTKKN